jgi:hypothetical protein
MRERFKRALSQVLRGPRACRLLERAGIDSRRYWLLMDLFGTLAERREFLQQLGRDGVTLEAVTWLYCGLSALFALFFIIAGMTQTTYLVSFIALTAFMLGSMLISETSNSLMNPVEGVILAHQPIDGATYTAAKLSHMVRIVLYMVPALNGIPAMAGLLRGFPWYYPLLHISIACAVGLVIALSCCALFGWLMRFVPAPRLKTAGQIAEMFPWLAYLFAQMIRATHIHLHPERWWPGPGPARVSLITGLILVVGAVVFSGLRALSGDYLVRVAAISQGRSRKVLYRKRRSVGALIRIPEIRAGFEYVWRMMSRDWHFRRQMISIIPMLGLMVAALVQGWRVSPFSGKFTFMHVVPHAFGILMFLVCSVIEQGNDYKGVWIFLLAPGGALGRFARGVYARLWLALVAIPHLVILAAVTVAWGVADAALFVAYSMAVASCYLGAELRLIDGLPFSKQPKTAQNPYIIPLMMAGGLGIAAAVGIQYFLVFRSMVAVAIATALLVPLAWLLTRSSLEAFTIAIRYNLGIETTESTAFYKEIL